MTRFFCFVAACLIATASTAQVPRVAVDIPPVHSLVARVMQGVGTPDLIITPGASPHGYSMRPSQAAALANADLVVWVGPGLTPWLERPLANLAAQADVLGLLEVQGTVLLPFREGAVFAAKDHDHDHGHNDNHNHGHNHGHDHGAIDPHAWLDPDNGAIWMGAIAQALSALDPENAALYAANASAGQAELAELSAKIEVLVTPFKGQPYIVFHDAYHYFEARFGVESLGALALSDASAPTPARLAAIREHVADLQIACVFSEPQFNAGLFNAVVEDTPARIAVLDPVGVDLPLGPDLYGLLLLQIANEMAGCAD